MKKYPNTGWKLPTILLLLVLGLLFSAGPLPAEGPPKTLFTSRQPDCYAPGKTIGSIAPGSIREASGLAVSRRESDCLWVVNDSGNAPVLHALSTTGTPRGGYTVAGARNRDWEDLAGFRLNDTPYLLIADVGDNKARYDICRLYIVKEPVCRDRPADTTAPVYPEWTIRFRYADGPRDCEAVAVDTPHNRILLLTKRTTPPLLYELPLKPKTSKKEQTARKIAALTTLPPPTPEDLRYRYGANASQPTAMDLSPDGNTLFILTYTHIYRYQRHTDQTWARALQARPDIIFLPHPSSGILKKREALALGPQSGDLLVTSEGTAPLIFQLRLRGE